MPATHLALELFESGVKEPEEDISSPVSFFVARRDLGNRSFVHVPNFARVDLAAGGIFPSGSVGVFF